MGISKNDIVTASINILNRKGIIGLSMRSIAGELKIKASSLYNHIGGKAELYSEIAECLCMQCVKPKISLSAERYIIAIAKSYRAMLLEVRDSVAIFKDSMPNTPYRFGIIEAWTERLIQYGVSKKNLMTVSNLINNYVLSFTEDELRIKGRRPEEIRIFMNMFAPGTRPVFINEHGFDEQFLLGLRLILAGIKSVNHSGKNKRKGLRDL